MGFDEQNKKIAPLSYIDGDHQTCHEHINHYKTEIRQLTELF